MFANLWPTILFEVAEVLIRWDATEACGAVKLTETTVLDEEDSLFLKLLTDCKYHALKYLYRT